MKSDTLRAEDGSRSAAWALFPDLYHISYLQRNIRAAKQLVGVYFEFLAVAGDDYFLGSARPV